MGKKYVLGSLKFFLDNHFMNIIAEFKEANSPRFCTPKYENRREE
jgi:hypothetical protein